MHDDRPPPGEGPPSPADDDFDAPLGAVRQELDEHWENLVDAAIEAEYDTGIREETEEQARRHIVIRLATIVAGFVVLTGGLAMLVLPGPGIVGVVAGLGILSTELEWAARLMAYVKKKARYEDLQAQPMWVQASMGLVALCTLAGSLVYFTVLR